MLNFAIIREKGGRTSNFPIIADKKGVIILGHEKYYAQKEMGKKITYKTYDIPEEVAYKYRLVDCRVANRSSMNRLKPFYEELFNNYEEYVSKKTKTKSKN
jgi:hypothetical protein